MVGDLNSKITQYKILEYEMFQQYYVGFFLHLQ